MALDLHSHHGAAKRLFMHHFRLSAIRYFSSWRMKSVNDNSHEQGLNHSDKRKSSTKTKTAKSMARLINSKPWSTDLESSLSSLSPCLSKTAVLQTLSLVKTSSKAVRFFNWVENMGFSHNSQSFFLMLEILGRERNLNAARNFLLSIERRSNGSVKLEDRFFNSLIRSYSKAGLYQESVKVFEMMKSIGVSPSVVTFNNLLQILLKRGRTNMARSVFDEMLSTYGVTPDVYTFNILIRGFCMNSLVDEGFRFFKEMERFRCDPDVVSYNTLVDGLCREGKVKIAHNVVKGMNKKSLHLNPNVVTYTTLVRGYCMKREVEDALAVYREMISQGLKPNRITYNTLIKGLCEVQKYDKIKEIMGGAKEYGGFIPDTCTFNTLINAHFDAGNLGESLKVFKSMSGFHVQPDSATYSILIRNLCQQRDFERAEELFDELADKEILLSDAGCVPLVAAYNPMFEYLCRNGKTKKAETVFRQLMKRGIQDPPSYKTLIMGHCREGTFVAGYELLVLMLRRDFCPDFETYDLLINGLLENNEALVAQETLEKMLKSSHLPKSSTFHSILSELLKMSFAHESAKLIMLMLERRIRQNIALSTHAVKLLFDRRLRDKAIQIVEILYDNGFVVEMEQLICYLCQDRKMLEAYKMLMFCLEKNLTVNTEMCSTVIEGLCKSKKLSEAFGLYYELAERGKHQELRCLDNFRIALEADGRSNEAEFVGKRMLQSERFSPTFSFRTEEH
ncbi:hypothetical protein SLE2022_365750 [Rubroshorea leprosula]